MARSHDCSGEFQDKTAAHTSGTPNIEVMGHGNNSPKGTPNEIVQTPRDVGCLHHHHFPPLCPLASHYSLYHSTQSCWQHRLASRTPTWDDEHPAKSRVTSHDYSVTMIHRLAWKVPGHRLQRRPGPHRLPSSLRRYRRHPVRRVWTCFGSCLLPQATPTPAPRKGPRPTCSGPPLSGHSGRGPAVGDSRSERGREGSVRWLQPLPHQSWGCPTGSNPPLTTADWTIAPLRPEDGQACGRWPSHGTEPGTGTSSREH